MTNPSTKPARTRARKPRSDSTAEIVRVAQGATQMIHPPAHIPLEGNDLLFWENVINEYARADWTEHQLELAAMLARSMADLEENQRLVREEGFLLYRDNGSAMENPRARTVGTLTNSILAQRRSLALHARGRAGDNRNAAAQKSAAKRLEEDINKGGDDPTGLLA